VRNTIYIEARLFGAFSEVKKDVVMGLYAVARVVV
jgi:hypothetical protein